MWNSITEVPPPHNKVVMTKIDRGGEVSNEQELKYFDRLWWLPDGSIYVYYTPTHWKYLV